MVKLSNTNPNKPNIKVLIIINTKITKIPPSVLVIKRLFRLIGFDKIKSTLFFFKTKPNKVTDNDKGIKIIPT